MVSPRKYFDKFFFFVTVVLRRQKAIPETDGWSLEDIENAIQNAKMTNGFILVSDILVFFLVYSYSSNQKF